MIENTIWYLNMFLMMIDMKSHVPANMKKIYDMYLLSWYQVECLHREQSVSIMQTNGFQK